MCALVDDPQMKVEISKGTFAQNEEPGFYDMKTEGYETDLATQWKRRVVPELACSAAQTEGLFTTVGKAWGCPPHQALPMWGEHLV